MLTLLSDKTDGDGLFYAVLKSKTPEQKIVSAQVLGVGKVSDTAVIQFVRQALLLKCGMAYAR